jgi:hypothetical protein
VLLVMLGLLLLLMVLGFTALTFTAQEHESANYYADAAQRQGVEVNSDVLFDYGLEQLLIGPREENMQSVLWPGRHSLIPNMLGMFGATPDGSGRTAPLDLHPFNGVGINLVADNLGQPVVIDPTTGRPVNNPNVVNLWLSSNLSPAALQALPNNQNYAADVTRAQLMADLPSADVDYTYPDINNVFLAHVESIQVNPSDPTRVVPVIIPSFHRPQYLRTNTQGAGDRVDVDPTNGSWDGNPTLATRVMRPHPSHQVVVYNANNQKPLYPTIKDTTNNSTIRVPRFQLENGVMKLDQASSIRNPNNNQRPREQGIWSLKPGATNAGVSWNDQLLQNYEYDVDNRGTGTRDGVWLDLGHPPFFLKDGRGVVPLFSFTVLPADGLINLNTAGNINELVTGRLTTSKASLVGQAFPNPPPSLSRSNFGRSAAEINPFWALSADPTLPTFLSPQVQANNPATGKPLLQHIAFQKYNPNTQYLMTRTEMANLELLFLQWGRPDFDVSNPSLIANGSVPVGKIIEGRNGETTTTESGWKNSTADTANRWTLFPRPGQPVPSGANLNQSVQTNGSGAITGVPGDDNYNQFAGWAADGANQPIYIDQHPGVAAREITPPAYVAATNRRLPLGTGTVAGWSTGYPIDLVGAGNSLKNTATGLTSALEPDPIGPFSSVKWPRFEMFQGGSQLQTRTVSAMTSVLVPNTNLLGLLDEPAEMIVDRRYRFPGLDSPFPVDELFSLHASAGDYAAASTGSRVRDLMPFNFETNQQAESIRRKFTTESWDRLNHSFHYDPQRTWEWIQAKVPGGQPIAGYISFPPVATQGTEPLLRNPVSAWIGMTMPAPNTVPAKDVWNQFEQLRLTPQFAGLNTQRRLDINRVAWLMNPDQAPLRFVDPNPNAANLSNTVRFRELTPHPVDPGVALPPALPASRPPLVAAADQEAWARIDRQFLARDIYTLLYLFGSDAEAGNPLQGDIYEPWQKLEMAQFAVNMVDAMDPDDVITEFRFDPNLANGWDTSADNSLPGDNSGSVPAVVYGVEAQSLVISEVLCLHQPKTQNDDDHAATPYDDADSNRWFTHIELRNASPYAVDLTKGNWRLSVVQQNQTDTRLATPRRPTTQLRTSLVFKRNLRPGSEPTNVRGGGILTIGSMGRDDGQVDTFNDTNGNPIVRSADIRLDADNTLDETFYRLSPQYPETSVPKKNTDSPPGNYLDLNHNSHYGKNYWQLIDYSAGTQDVSNNPQFRGGFLRGSETPGPTSLDESQPIKIVLERRAHLGRTSPANPDPQYDESNPWITVDEFTVQPQILKIDSANMAQTELRTRLLQLASTERIISLVRDEVGNSDGPQVYQSPIHPDIVKNAGRGLLRNTFSVNNLSNSNNTRVQAINNNRIWQPHYDREFHSVMDLLGLPLYGPHLTTARLANGNQMLLEKTVTASNSRALPPNPVPCVAAARFLQPTHPSIQAQGNWSPHNRWFRVLELLEVRPMDQDALLTQRPELWSEILTRTPGRLQLNALPHGDNLFALLDDPQTFSLQTTNNVTRVVDTWEYSGTERNWWFELLKTRDGVDPLLKQFTSGDPVILPGAPSSRPFRGLSHAVVQTQGNANQSLLPETTEHGLLRRLGKDASTGFNVPLDVRTPTRFSQQGQAYRRLFEARSQNDLAVGEVDLPSRHRLLAKVANNSTSRGHVFMVWMSVGFFDAVFPDPQNPAIVQVGAELEDQARRRGFFVVDRSLLEEAYIPPQIVNGQQQPGTFDFRKFVQYRRTMQ